MNPTDRIVRLLKMDVDRLKRRNEELMERIERLERFQGARFVERKYEEKGEFPKYDGDGKPLDIHGNEWDPKVMNEGENH